MIEQEKRNKMVEGETVFVAAKLKEKAEEVKLIEYLECTVESQPYKNYITALRFLLQRVHPRTSKMGLRR